MISVVYVYMSYICCILYWLSQIVIYSIQYTVYSGNKSSLLNRKGVIRKGSQRWGGTGV